MQNLSQSNFQVCPGLEKSEQCRRQHRDFLVSDFRTAFIVGHFFSLFLQDSSPKPVWGRKWVARVKIRWQTQSIPTNAMTLVWRCKRLQLSGLPFSCWWVFHHAKPPHASLWLRLRTIIVFLWRLKTYLITERQRCISWRGGCFCFLFLFVWFFFFFHSKGSCMTPETMIQTIYWRVKEDKRVGRGSALACFPRLKTFWVWNIHRAWCLLQEGAYFTTANSVTVVPQPRSDTLVLDGEKEILSPAAEFATFTSFQTARCSSIVKFVHSNDIYDGADNNPVVLKGEELLIYTTANKIFLPWHSTSIQSAILWLSFHLSSKEAFCYGDQMWLHLRNIVRNKICEKPRDEIAIVSWIKVHASRCFTGDKRPCATAMLVYPPPFRLAEAPTYWKLSMLITSMIGLTTRERSCCWRDLQNKEKPFQGNQTRLPVPMACNERDNPFKSVVRKTQILSWVMFKLCHKYCLRTF